MSEKSVKLRIDIEPQMNELKQEEVIGQIKQIEQAYSESAKHIFDEGGSVFDKDANNIYSGLQYVAGPIGEVENQIVSAVQNIGRVFTGVTDLMSAHLKDAFSEPVSLLQQQMSFIASTHNKTTNWSAKAINDVAAARMYATDYATRINEMSKFLVKETGDGFERQTIGSVDHKFFRNFEKLRSAYLTGIEELQHKGTLPTDRDVISARMSNVEGSKIYTAALNQAIGDISQSERQRYTQFMTNAALPFYYYKNNDARDIPFIRKPGGITPYDHLPEEYQELYKLASNHSSSRQMPFLTATKKQSSTFKVYDDIFSKIQELAEKDETDVLYKLAESAGLAEIEGHKVTWRNRGSQPQIQHFLASLPVKLEEVKRGGLQYREDSLEADRWNRRSVAVDNAIEELAQYGITPQLYTNALKASSASFKTGKQTYMRALGFPKSYIIPKVKLDENTEFEYVEPTEEAIRVPRGRKAGVESKNDKFVSANDSALMRMLRQAARNRGYTVNESDELAYYTDKSGTKRPLMLKASLEELWDEARDASGFFPEGGYDALKDETKKKISSISEMMSSGKRYNGTHFDFGFLNKQDVFFVPRELKKEIERIEEEAGVAKALQAGNILGLMGLPNEEDLIKQINNVKNFNTPSHGEDEFYSIRTSPKDKKGVSTQYLNWTALSKLFEMRTGKPMGKENILDSLAFVTPGGLFDEGFQGRAAGPVMKFAAVVGDLPKTLEAAGLTDKGTFGIDPYGVGGKFIVPSGAVNPESKKEMENLFRYYFGGEEMHTSNGIVKTKPMSREERINFENQWLFNAAEKTSEGKSAIDMFFADTSIKAESRYLTEEQYKKQRMNDLLAHPTVDPNQSEEDIRKAMEQNERDIQNLIDQRRKQMKELGEEEQIQQGLIRLNAGEFKHNLDVSTNVHGGIAVARDTAGFEVNKNYIPSAMVQSLNLPYSAYEESIQNYNRMLANWRDPTWVRKHGFANVPAYQKAMERDPSFMEFDEGARSYIQNQINQIREHIRKGDLASSNPGYSAMAGMTTGMAVDFLTKLTGSAVDKDSPVAPLLKSSLLQKYTNEISNVEAQIQATRVESEKDKLIKQKQEYESIRSDIERNKYFIAPGLKFDGGKGAHKAVAERYPTAWGTAVAGRNLYYNPDGTVNKEIKDALEFTGAKDNVFYLPPEAIYKMNTGDFDGDTIWAYVSKADEWLKGVENIDEQLENARKILKERKEQQEKNIGKVPKAPIDKNSTLADNALRASFLDVYSKSAMGIGSAVIRNALQMPAGLERDKAILEGVEYYDLATSEIKKKGVTSAKLGKEGFKALLVGQNFDRLMRSMYGFTNADEEGKEDSIFQSIFKSNIGSINDTAALGTIRVNQSTAKAAGGNFGLHKMMQDYLMHNYDLDTELGKGAEWYSKIRINDLTGQHFVTPEDIEEGYRHLSRIKAEQARLSPAEQEVWGREIANFERALEFMQSPESTSQKNIDRARYSKNPAISTLAKNINEGQGYNYEDEIYEVLEAEKQKRIQEEKAIEAMQEDERYKNIVGTWAHNPNRPSSFPRYRSVTAVEPWFDPMAMPRKQDPILTAKEYALREGESFTFGEFGDRNSKSRKVYLGYGDEEKSSFGNSEYLIEKQKDEILGQKDSIDLALGDAMHKAFEDFWNEGALSKKPKTIGQLAESIQRKFSEVLNPEGRYRIGNDKKTFASRIGALGYELYHDDKRDLYQLRAKKGFYSDEAQQNALEQKVLTANNKLQNMQGYLFPGAGNQRLTGSLGDLVRYIYSQPGDVQIVGTEGRIFNNGFDYNEDTVQKGEPTTYELPNGRMIRTHARPDAVIKIGDKYHIIDYKSSGQGAKDSITQSMLYQKMYEERAKEALEAGRFNDPFAQFGSIEINDKGEKVFKSNFGDIFGFDALNDRLVMYGNAHKQWNGKDYIDVVRDEYLNAIQRKEEDLEEGHYSAGQRAILESQDKKLAEYYMNNNIPISDALAINEQLSDAKKRVKERTVDGYKGMTPTQIAFYTSQFAQDREALDEIEKTLYSENAKLSRRYNPVGMPYDRFKQIEDRLSSVLGIESLDKIIEAYSDGDVDMDNHLRNQLARKVNATRMLSSLRSQFALEDVADAKRNITSMVYGVDYDKGGQNLFKIWNQINRAQGTINGIKSNPDYYDDQTGVFRTEDDSEKNPERWKNKSRIAKEAEKTRAKNAREAQQSYISASNALNELETFASSVAFEKITKTDIKESEAELDKILGKPLEVKSVDDFYQNKVDALIGYVRQKDADIQRLSSIPPKSKYGIKAHEQAFALIAQRDKAASYLKDPASLARVIENELGSNGPSATPIERIEEEYQRKIQNAELISKIATKDEKTLKALGIDESGLATNGVITGVKPTVKATSPFYRPGTVRMNIETPIDKAVEMFSQTDNFVESIANAASFDRQRSAEHISNTHLVSGMDFTQKYEEVQKKIKLEYAELWKAQATKMVEIGDEVENLSLESIVGGGDPAKLNRLLKIQKALQARYNIIEATDKDGKPIYSESEKLNFMKKVSDTDIINYVGKQADNEYKEKMENEILRSSQNLAELRQLQGETLTPEERASMQRKALETKNNQRIREIKAELKTKGLGRDNRRILKEELEALNAFDYDKYYEDTLSKYEGSETVSAHRAVLQGNDLARMIEKYTGTGEYSPEAIEQRTAIRETSQTQEVQPEQAVQEIVATQEQAVVEQAAQAVQQVTPPKVETPDSSRLGQVATEQAQKVVDEAAKAASNAKPEPPKVDSVPAPEVTAPPAVPPPVGPTSETPPPEQPYDRKRADAHYKALEMEHNVQDQIKSLQGKSNLDPYERATLERLQDRQMFLDRVVGEDENGREITGRDSLEQGIYEQDKAQEKYRETLHENNLDYLKRTGELSLAQQRYGYDRYHRQQQQHGMRSRIASYYQAEVDRHDQLGLEIERKQADYDKRKADLDAYKKANASEIKKGGEVDKNIETREQELKNLEGSLQASREEFNNFNQGVAASNAVMASFGATVQMVATRALRQFFRKALNEAKQFINQFDKAMTEIQMITLKTDSEIASLGDKLINTALSTGSSVSETTSAAANLYRQGLSDEEVEERLDDVLKFAHVAGIKTNEASKIITTALQNGLVGSSEEAMDALVALGDTAATTASEIAKGMQKSAAAAKQAGMSYGELVTLLTIGTSKTQLGGSTIGSSLNTLIYRLYKVNNNEDFTDENGRHISSTAASKALSNLGISLYDEKGQFRGPYQILMDIASKWNDADDTTQSMILTTLGAGRQRSNIATLLQGMAEDDGELAQRYLDTAETSSGITDRKNEEYLNSLEAKKKNFKTSFDAVIESTDVSGLKSVLDIFTKILDVFAKGNEALGGWPVKLIAIAAATAMAVAAFTALKTTLIAMGTAISTNPYLIAFVAIAAAAASISLAIGAASRAAEDAKKANNERIDRNAESSTKLINSKVSSFQEKKNDRQEKIKRAEKLISKFENDTLQGDEEVELTGILKDLGVSFDEIDTAAGSATKNIDSWKNAIKEAKEETESANEALIDNIRLLNGSLAVKANKDTKDALDAIEEEYSPLIGRTTIDSEALTRETSFLKLFNSSDIKDAKEQGYIEFRRNMLHTWFETNDNNKINEGIKNIYNMNDSWYAGLGLAEYAPDEATFRALFFDENGKFDQKKFNKFVRSYVIKSGSGYLGNVDLTPVDMKPALIRNFKNAGFSESSLTAATTHSSIAEDDEFIAVYGTDIGGFASDVFTDKGGWEYPFQKLIKYYKDQGYDDTNANIAASNTVARWIYTVVDEIQDSDKQAEWLEEYKTSSIEAVKPTWVSTVIAHSEGKLESGWNEEVQNAIFDKWIEGWDPTQSDLGSWMQSNVSGLYGVIQDWAKDKDTFMALARGNKGTYKFKTYDSTGEEVVYGYGDQEEAFQHQKKIQEEEKGRKLTTEEEREIRKSIVEQSGSTFSNIFASGMNTYGESNEKAKVAQSFYDQVFGRKSNITNFKEFIDAVNEGRVTNLKGLFETFPEIANKMRQYFDFDEDFNIVGIKEGIDESETAFKGFGEFLAQFTETMKEYQEVYSVGEKRALADKFVSGEEVTDESLAALASLTSNKSLSVIYSNSKIKYAEAVEKYNEEYERIKSEYEATLDEGEKFTEEGFEKWVAQQNENLEEGQEPITIPERPQWSDYMYYDLNETDKALAEKMTTRIRNGQSGLTNEDLFSQAYNMIGLAQEGRFTEFETGDKLGMVQEVGSKYQGFDTWATGIRAIEEAGGNLSTFLAEPEKYEAALKGVGISLGEFQDVNESINRQLSVESKKAWFAASDAADEYNSSLENLAKGGATAQKEIAEMNKAAYDNQDAMTAWEEAYNGGKIKSGKQMSAKGREAIAKFLGNGVTAEQIKEWTARDMELNFANEQSKKNIDENTTARIGALWNDAIFDLQKYAQEHQLTDINGEPITITQAVKWIFETDDPSEQIARFRQVAAGIQSDAMDALENEAAVQTAEWTARLITNEEGTVFSVAIEASTTSKYKGGKPSYNNRGGSKGGGKSKTEKTIEEGEHRVKEAQHKVKMAQIKQAHYEFTNEYQNELNAVYEEVAAQKGLAEAYEQNIAAYTKQQGAVKKYSEEWWKLQEAIHAAEEALKETQNTIEALGQKEIAIVQRKQEWEDAPEEFKRSIINSYVQRYQTEYQSGGSMTEAKAYEKWVNKKQEQSASLKEQIAMNKIQIEEWEALLSTLDENTENYRETQKKIWEIQKENAELENELLSQEIELNNARLERIAQVLQRQTGASEHQITMSETRGSISKIDRDYNKYRMELRSQASEYAYQGAYYQSALEAARAQMNSVTKYSAAWYAARDAVYQYEEALEKLGLTQKELEEALRQSYLEEVTESIENRTTNANLRMQRLQEYTRAQKLGGNENKYISGLEKERKELQRQQSEQQTSLDELIALRDSGNIAKGTKEWDELLKKIKEVQNEIAKTQNDELEKAKEIAAVKLESIMGEYEDRTLLTNHNINLLQYQESKYKNAGELTNYGVALQAERNAQNKLLREQKRTLGRLYYEIGNYAEGSEEYENVLKQILKLEEEASKTESAIENTTREIKKNKEAIRQAQLALENAIESEIKKRIEKQKQQLAAEINLQNTILDVVKRRYQEEWNLVKKDLDKKKQALQEEKSMIQERMNARKEAEQTEDKYTRLAELQRQLSVIEADPTRSKEAKELRKEIADLQKEISGDLADNLAQAEMRKRDDDVKGINDYINNREEDLSEYLKNNNNFSDIIDQLLSGTEKDFVKFMQQYNEDYKNKTPREQKQMEQAWHDTWLSMQGLEEKYWDQIKPYVEGVTDENASIRRRELLTWVKQGDEYKNADSDAERKSILYKWGELFDTFVSAQKLDAEAGKPREDIMEEVLTTMAANQVTKEDLENMSHRVKLDDETRNMIADIANAVAGAKKYATGGLVDYTGVALVHGSKTNPESFLSASDTRFMRNYLDAVEGIGATYDVAGMRNAIENAFQYVSAGSFIDPSSYIKENNYSVGDVNITINQAEINNDQDIHQLAKKIGDAFTRELTKTGFNTASYAF